jgi:uncharacterized protein YoaH (UPF0181 family)
LRQESEQQKYRIGALGQRILDHLKRHHPKEYKALLEDGSLYRVVHNQQERAQGRIAELLEKGLNIAEAHEICSQHQERKEPRRSRQS